ncbi:MAG: elongation factor P [Vulcanimicrobiota bacterium]
MISSNDFRNGMTIILDGELYNIVEFLHVKPGKGAAFVRTKIKSLKSGNVLEKTFRAGEKVERAHVTSREMQYLYPSDDIHVFMDNETFIQYNITEETMGDAMKWLKDGANMQVQLHDDTVIGVEAPAHMELEITHTEPGFKGDTAQGGTKPAELETGATVNVPLFVNQGEKILVDTRSGEYLRRV